MKRIYFKFFLFCFRKSAFIISDSDGSQQGSCPPSLNNSVNLVEDSAEAFDEDSSNDASMSFVPDSIPNTPQTEKQRSVLIESFTRASSSDNIPEIFPPNCHNASILRQNIGSVRRITPLKIDRSLTQENPSFAQALAASPIITPQTSPQQNLKCSSVPQHLNKTLTDNNEDTGSSSDDDSPIKIFRKKKVQAFYSESEESDEEDKHSSYRMNSTQNGSPTEQFKKKKVQAVQSESDEEEKHHHDQMESTQNEKDFEETGNIDSCSEHSNVIEEEELESNHLSSEENEDYSLLEQSNHWEECSDDDESSSVFSADKNESRNSEYSSE